MTTLPLTLLVPVPGCLPRSGPATCTRTPPAGRKFTLASNSETGRKSSAGPETPPLTHLVPVGPCNLTVSDHELECKGETTACATEAGKNGVQQQQKQTEHKHQAHMQTPMDELMDCNDGESD